LTNLNYNQQCMEEILRITVLLAPEDVPREPGLHSPILRRVVIVPSLRKEARVTAIIVMTTLITEESQGLTTLTEDP